MGHDVTASGSTAANPDFGVFKKQSVMCGVNAAVLFVVSNETTNCGFKQTVPPAADCCCNELLHYELLP